MDSFVLILNGKERFIELKSPDRWETRSSQLTRSCDNLVRDMKLCTPRKNPSSVIVKIFQLEIVNGELKRRFCADKTVQLPSEDMTESEYNEELADAVKELPEPFQRYVCNLAYDDGHSAGYEEVVSIAERMATELLPVIKEYEKMKR